MNKKTVKDISVSGKRVLVRVDFNVPLDNSGEITDDSRIRATLPTIEYLIGQQAKIILLSHLGRPKGRVIEELRLVAVARRLSQLMGRPVGMAADCVGPEVERSIAAMENGDILLLENLRFHAGEESGDASFSAALAKLGDVFVNDAFGTSHRAHASISGISNYLPAVAGFRLQKEVQALSKIIGDTAHPFATILGGAKMSDKVAMIENIMPRVDSLLIGGAMASTFLKALAYPVGLSLVEVDMLEKARVIVRGAEKKRVHLLLPTDVVIADEISDEAATEIVAIENVPPDKKIVDMGPRTIDNFGKELNNCKTVFWNGPMGIYEIPSFAGGTRALANVVANLEAATIIGGGSTADIIYEMGLADKMTFISTGGGASLEFLSGEALPGVAALLDMTEDKTCGGS